MEKPKSKAKEKSKAKAKTKKFSIKNLDKQDKALLGTMASLIVLVIVLGVIAINLKNNEQNVQANITIPILEKQTQNEISVDLSEMSNNETKEYIFKITNYKQADVNEIKIDYDIVIDTSDCVKLELYKDGSEENLLDDENYKIEDNTLPKDEKATDEYHLIITTISEPSETDKITLKINS